MLTRSFLARLALLGAFAWLAAPQASAQALRLAVSRGPVSLPVYVAQAQELFAREGVPLQTVECSSGRDCLKKLQDGEADLATASELLVSLAAMQPTELAVVATLSASSEHIKLVARRDAALADDAKSARGKRFATVPGTSAQYFLDNWMLVQGVDAAQTVHVPLAPERMADALARGEVDALAVWEPVAADARRALGPDAVVLPTARVYKQHFCLVLKRPLLAARDPDLVRVLRALERASASIRARPDDAKAVLMQRLQVDRAFADAHWHEHEYRLALDQSLVSTMDRQQRWARQGAGASAPRTPLNPLDAIEPSLLRRAVPGAVTLLP